MYLTPLGRFDEAIAELRRCLELDPFSVQFQHDLGWAFVYARQYDRAIAQVQKAIEMELGFDQAYFGLGQAYLGQRLYEKAIPALQKMVDLAGASPYALRALGWAYGVLGKKDEARQLLDMLQGGSLVRPATLGPALHRAITQSRIGEIMIVLQQYGTALAGLLVLALPRRLRRRCLSKMVSRQCLCSAGYHSSTS